MEHQRAGSEREITQGYVSATFKWRADDRADVEVEVGFSGLGESS
jgi:hypothetical protein